MSKSRTAAGTAASGRASSSPAQAKRGDIDIGSRLELFVDDFLIDRMSRAQLQLHHPTPKEVAIRFDEPWEGITSCYYRVFKDGDLFRMYYRGSDYDLEKEKASDQFVCYAESTDGIEWTKPHLKLNTFRRSKKNNIVWKGAGVHNFAPFKDDNPDCKPGEEYKALAGGRGGLCAFRSPDGVRWEMIREEPVITHGAFDSQNLAFWDTVRGQYVDFHRHFWQRGKKHGVRHIMTCTSQDFINWTEPEWLDFGNAPLEHLYTNAITPYPRAPHIFMGFPKRFSQTRNAHLGHMRGISDGVFMTSRDGLHWKRWGEAFIRPGPQKERWVNRNNMTAWGILETESDMPGTPNELSLYSSEGYYHADCRLRRFTLRQDGFVSVRADLKGGEFLTKPFIFEGKKLALNYSTSAVGSVQVEVQTPTKKAIRGLKLEHSDEVYGDELAGTAKWSGKEDLSHLSGKPIRLRFVLSDADLYSMQFLP